MNYDFDFKLMNSNSNNNFYLEVKEDNLLVSNEIYNMMVKCGANYSLFLLSYLRSTPTYFYNTLNCSKKELRNYTARLILLMKTKVNKKYLVKQKPIQFAMGVILDPSLKSN